MPLEELKNLNADQLTAKEQELRTELFHLKTGNSTEKVKDVSKFKKIKKDIARILTLQQQQKAATKA